MLGKRADEREIRTGNRGLYDVHGSAEERARARLDAGNRHRKHAERKKAPDEHADPHAAGTPMARRVPSAPCPYHRPMTSQTDTDLSAAAKLAIEYLREHDDEHLAQLDEFLLDRAVSADPERAGETSAARRNGSPTS